MNRPNSAPASAPEPQVNSDPPQFPIAPRAAIGFASTALNEVSLDKAPETEREPAITPTAAAPIDTLRNAVAAALTKDGHASAGQLLGNANWTLDGANLRIAVPGLGKKMLSLTINAAAEKIIRQELQRLGAPSRFMVVPGEGIAQAPATAPAAGSVQESALNHPMVQRAKEIFNAEVRSVVDLRQK